MAESKLDMTLTWENKKLFKLEVRDGGQGQPSGPKIEIVKAEEDGQIVILWEYLQGACERYFKAQLEKIGVEMKKP